MTPIIYDYTVSLVCSYEVAYLSGLETVPFFFQ